MISISDKESGLAAETSSSAGKEVRLTVTGLDESGQMFRESAPILESSGRHCAYRSKFQPKMGSWVLIEFDGSNAGGKRMTLQGQVKSAQPEGLAGTAFRIQVELESAPGLKIVANARPEKPVVSSAPVVPVTAAVHAAPVLPPQAPALREESLRRPKEALAELFSRAKPEINAATPFDFEVPPSKAVAPVNWEVPAPKSQAEAPELNREAAAAIAVEVNRQWTALKGSFSEEFERTAQRAVSSSLEPMIRQAVEKQIAANYETALQTLHSDVTFQLAGRLAGSEEVRNSVEKMAKKALEEQVGQAQYAAIEGLRNSQAGLAEFVQTFEKTFAEIESKIKNTEGAAVSALERAETLGREAADSTEQLQNAVGQLNQSARSTMEKFDGQMTARLNSWSAQFKNHVDDVSREKAAQFAAGLQQLSAQVREANEVLEKLSAGLQLARDGVDMQETHWAERSREMAAEFEKEIKSVLIRLAGTI